MEIREHRVIYRGIPERRRQEKQSESDRGSVEQQSFWFVSTTKKTRDTNTVPNYYKIYEITVFMVRVKVRT